jgi:hypothetical protein
MRWEGGLMNLRNPYPIWCNKQALKDLPPLLDKMRDTIHLKLQLCHQQRTDKLARPSVEEVWPDTD